MKTVLKIFIPLCIFCAGFLASSFKSQDNKWIAPASADTLTNPQRSNPKALAEGKKVYDKFCWVCHGLTGKGDGPGAVNLNPQPADHTSTIVQDQSDGALYWKISKGRGQMTPYERTLNKTQRWQLVVYIRSLAPAEK